MEVADVLGLRQPKKLVPGERDCMFDQAADCQLPHPRVHVRLLSQIEDRPVPDLMLADGELRHAVTIARTAASRRLTAKFHIDGTLVEINLTLNVLLAALNEIRCVGHPICIQGSDPNEQIGVRPRRLPLAWQWGRRSRSVKRRLAGGDGHADFRL